MKKIILVAALAAMMIFSAVPAMANNCDTVTSLVESYGGAVKSCSQKGAWYTIRGYNQGEVISVNLSKKTLKKIKGALRDATFSGSLEDIVCPTQAVQLRTAMSWEGQQVEVQAQPANSFGIKAGAKMVSLSGGSYYVEKDPQSNYYLATSVNMVAKGGKCSGGCNNNRPDNNGGTSSESTRVDHNGGTSVTTTNTTSSGRNDNEGGSSN